MSLTNLYYFSHKSYDISFIYIQDYGYFIKFPMEQKTEKIFYLNLKN